MRYRNPRVTNAKRHILGAALASCLLMMATGADAQSASSTLRGRVTAEAAAAPGAEVVVTNTATGLTRRTLSGEDGGYSIAGLPPGTYQVEVAAGGASSRQTITLQVAQTATVNLGVAAGATPTDTTTLDSIEVVGTNVQEVKTSEISTYITPQQIDALPQVSRNFLAFADIVPGMKFEEGTDGSTKLRGGAQNSNAINVYIDGVGQKNYVLKGGVSGQDSSRGSPFPQSAIGEYKVITQNYKAEFDQVSSAAVVAVTKSGTNEFDGNVFYDRTSDSWRATRPIERAPGKTPSREEQYGASFGGPIVRDLLHFFVSYEAKDRIDPRDVTLGENINVSQLPPDIAALLGSTGAPFNMDLYFGKLTWSPDESNLVELTAKHRTESEITGLGGVNASTYGTSKDNEETRVDLRYQYSAENWLNDAHITFEDAFYQPRPLTIGPGFNYVTPDRRAVLNLGGGRDYQDKGQKGYSFQDDLTFFAGDHTFKGGLKYKSVEINAFEQQPYNPQYIFRINDLAAGYDAPSEVQFGAPVPGAGDRDITTKNKQFGIYFQDDWEVNDKLTLNLGLRWDYEDSPGYLDYAPRPELVAALRGWSNIQNTDYDIEDYIGNGSNRDAFKDAWQPRIGFSYDLFADQRHVLFGGLGRSYDRNLWDYLALEQSKGTFPAYTYTFDAPSNPDCATQANCLGAWNDSYLDPNVLAALVAANPNLGGEIQLNNNNLKTPYSDQLSFGIRNTIGQWNSSVTLSHIRSKDGIVFSLGNRWPDGSYRNPARPGATWGSQPWDFPIPGFGRLILADNGIETKSNALLISLDKPFTEESNWGTTVALTFTDAKENRTNAGAADEHGLFDYPNLDGARWNRAVGTPRSRLVATAIVGVPWDMRLSGKLTLESPVVKEGINCYNAVSFDNCYFDSFEVDGTFGHRQFDLSLTKDFAFGEDYSANFRIDALNVFNHTNYLDYDTWRGGPGEPNANFQVRNGLGTAWPPRMVKVSVGFNW